MRWKLGIFLTLVLVVVVVRYAVNTKPAVAPPGLEANPEDLILELSIDGPLFFENTDEGDIQDLSETVPNEISPTPALTVPVSAVPVSPVPSLPVPSQPVQATTIPTGPGNSLSTAQLIQLLGEESSLDAACGELALRGEEVIDDLKTALQDENWQVRAGVVFALSQLGESATPSLDALQELAKSDDQEAVRSAARFAIDAIQKR